MTNIIMTLTRLSFLTSIMALIVLGIRFCLRKAPKTYTYILWIFVFIRAIMPASYTSDYSLSFPHIRQQRLPPMQKRLKPFQNPLLFQETRQRLFHKPKKRPSQRKTCSTHGS